MAEIKFKADLHRKELHSQLAERIALLMIGTSGLVIWLLSGFMGYLPASEIGLSSAMLLTGVVTWALVKIQPMLARHLTVWGLTAGLVAAMKLFPVSWLPFLGLMLVFVGAMMLRGGGFVVAGMVTVAAIWLTSQGIRDYPLFGLLVSLIISMTLAWQITRTLYDTLDWSWAMQQRADHLLEVARDRQGELNRVLKSLDLTNTLLNRTQRDLISARRRAEEARLTKEQFAANVSHELRTPLNLVLGFSEMIYLSPEIYGDMQWPPKLRRAIYQIYRSSRHLLEMIDDVLELSRFEMVGFTLNKEPMSLEPLMRETAEIADDLFQGREVCLEVEIALDLPVLDIDRTRIRQVLLNLLSNAARFTEEGTVRVEARQVEREVIVSVSDTGPGIPPDKVSHIFEEFYQVDNTLRRKHGGTGLGLAISKRFVEAHQGRIFVETEMGIGSTFSFALPIPGEGAQLSRLQSGRLPDSTKPTPSPPVIVVDPDPAVAAMVGRYVASCEVVHVGDTERLADEIEIYHPKAVVWNVPPEKWQTGDGIGPNDALALPVSLIECSLPSRAWLAQDLAVAACLTKPITPQSLLREINRLGDVRDVLVVDDERGFCQLVEQMLETAGRPVEVRHAYDGTEGLAAMKVRPPDLVLLDIMMTGMDGFQVLDEMRQQPNLADVPVVLLTASSYVESALAQFGGQMVIRHRDGLSPAEVLRCLEAVIGGLELRSKEWLES
ncbi:MAG: response regulator [Chloroflexi bacterium]|nr:response regulator [Chloroflexota bacterium]